MQEFKCTVSLDCRVPSFSSASAPNAADGYHNDDSGDTERHSNGPSNGTDGCSVDNKQHSNQGSAIGDTTAYLVRFVDNLAEY